MTFVNNARSAKQTSEKETEISGKLEAIIVAVNEISQLVTIKDDQDELAVILKGLQNMKRRYDYQVDTVDKENTRIETVHKILTTISTRHLKTISDRQKKQSSFTERTADVKSRIVELMCKRYIIDESGIILKPDNQSCNYSNIAVSETDWVVQGKVIYW